LEIYIIDYFSFLALSCKDHVVAHVLLSVLYNNF